MTRSISDLIHVPSGEPRGTMSEPLTIAVSLRDLAVGYGAVEILSEINLSMAAGECWLLSGANGSGKTTLLNTIAGLLRPLRGVVERSPGLVLSYVPAEGSLSPTLPLRLDEVALMGAFSQHPAGPSFPRPTRQRAQGLLRRLGLWPKRRQAFNRSSSGERQRTLLARALMAAPNLLLMDEPTSNLDRDSLSYFMETLRSLGRDGMGMLVSTHLHDQFAPLTPGVLELRDGRIAVSRRDGDG